jgi:hypothetical protein
VIDEEVPQERDAAMLGLLATLGIEKGRSFEPDPDDAAMMEQAVRDAQAAMHEYLLTQALTPKWPDSRWLAIKPGLDYGFTFTHDGRLDYEHRAGGFAYWATWAPKHLEHKPGTLPASAYVQSFADSDGEPFHGDRSYRLRFPADTPARDFWSLVAYDVTTNGFIRDVDRVGVSSYDRSALQINADGSIDIYIGPEAPPGRESNWLPTAGQDFWLMTRFYGPTTALYDDSWTLQDVTPGDG